MNPTISEAFVAAELEKDEAAARAEYLAEFRTDIETFFSREIVEACVEPGVHARPPRDGIRVHGLRRSVRRRRRTRFALAIAHAEGDDVVLDLVHERRAPLSPEAAVEEFVGAARSPTACARSSATATPRNSSASASGRTGSPTQYRALDVGRTSTSNSCRSSRAGGPGSSITRACRRSSLAWSDGPAPAGATRSRIPATDTTT